MVFKTLRRLATAGPVFRDTKLTNNTTRSSRRKTHRGEIENAINRDRNEAAHENEPRPLCLVVTVGR